MANKKITVVGDGAEEPLTPEEEQHIEARVDEMLDPNLPDQNSQPAQTVPGPAATEESEPPEEPVAPQQGAPEPPATSPENPPEKPKVTKIVTTFADDEPEEAEAPAPEPVKVDAEVADPVPEPVVEEKPKPAARKITVKLHDEDEEAATEEPKKEVKPAKAKPAAKEKKPAKKLNVTVADGSQPEDLADAIAASALAAEEMIGAKPEAQEASAEEPAVPEVEPAQPESEPETPEVEKAPEPETTESEAEPEAQEESAEADDASGGAPPLILKHSTAPIGASEAEELTEPEETTPEAEESQPAPKTEITVEEPEEEAEEISVEVEPEAVAESAPSAEEVEPEAEAAPEETKKYRPPEGPIQFKRAEVPIEPHKPGEPRPEESAASELSEDEALAQAFEAPKTKVKKEKTKHAPGSLLKLLKWVVILAIVAGVVAVGAVPSLRHKALNLVGLDKTTSKPKTSAVSTPTPTPAPASTGLSPDIYVSKRSGVYNIYKANATGQQEQLVLAGTGNETSSLAMAPNADGTYASLVSTRDNKRNSAGALQQSVTLVAAADGKATPLDSADQIKLIDWFGTKLVYVLLDTSTSTSDPNRYQIISYDTASKSRIVIDHMNYLNDVLAAKGSVYYATATGVSGNAQFTKVQPDGSNKQAILSSEVAAITRTSYGAVVLSTVNKWYDYQLGAAQATATNNVGQTKSRLYIDSPDGKHSVYLTDTDIVVTDTATGKEITIPVTKPTYPVHWLSNDTVVFRNNGADYQVKASGGTPAKIVSVTDVPGISLWHQQ